MSKNPLYLPSSFTDEDWHLIVAALSASKSGRARELARQLLEWRIECARTRAAFLQVFKGLHKL